MDQDFLEYIKKGLITVKKVLEHVVNENKFEKIIKEVEDMIKKNEVSSKEMKESKMDNID